MPTLCTKCGLKFVETRETSWWGYPFCSACDEAMNREYEEYERRDRLKQGLLQLDEGDLCRLSGALRDGTEMLFDDCNFDPKTGKW